MQPRKHENTKEAKDAKDTKKTKQEVRRSGAWRLDKRFTVRNLEERTQ